MLRIADFEGPHRDRMVEELDRDGVTTVPLLDAAACRGLIDTYHQLTDERGFGCRPSTISPDAGFRLAARDAVREVLQPAVGRLLPGHRCVVAAFVPKEPGPSTQMAMHRDWSTCDERTHTPLEFWIPLTRQRAEDGTLHVVRGSHLGAPTLRGSGMSMVEEGPSTAPDRIEALEVPTGTAVVFHPALLHGSGPNHGGSLRLAVISAFQPRDAATMHFSQTDDGLQAHEVDPDFFVSNPSSGDPIPGSLVSLV